MTKDACDSPVPAADRPWHAAAMQGALHRGWPFRRIIVPGILSAGLVAFLLGVADQRTLRRAIVLPPAAIAAMVGLTVVFLAMKGVVWYQLVRRAEISWRPREIVFAYLGGEITKVLPGGIYFQNYLLGKLSGHPLEFGVATSLVLVGMDAAVAMALVLGLGIPGWPQLRPALLAFSVGWVALLLALWRSGLVGHLADWSGGRHPLLAKGMREADLLYEGLRRIWHPWFWLRLLALTGIYLFANCLELWVVTAGSPAGCSLSLARATAAAAFSILIPMMLPIPVQLGVGELSGTGALVAMGMPLGKAVSLMFAMRLWGTGLIFPLALGVMAAMPDLWKRSTEPWPTIGTKEAGDRPPSTS